jgi:hypothetical protein
MNDRFTRVYCNATRAALVGISFALSLLIGCTGTASPDPFVGVKKLPVQGLVKAMKAPSPPQVRNDDPALTLYITRTGSRYHRGGCKYTRQSSIPISLQDAIKRGYIPCSRCKPPIAVEPPERK